MTRVLVVNAGSSSLKMSAIELGRLEPLAATQIDWGSDATAVPDRRGTLTKAFATLAEHGYGADAFDLVAHRVVHGGTLFRAPTLIDENVIGELSSLEPLAPLHNPVAVWAMHAQRRIMPDLPAVAVFDTAFHATLPEDGYVYALPWSWYAEWGVRRFGFHGISVTWSVRRAAELLGRSAADLSLTVAHLGNGCSVTAVRGGASVSTSMGLTPLEGLVMGTRAGSIDPGALLYAMREHGLDRSDLARVLDQESGLLGVSGLSGDVRMLVDAAGSGNDRARLALDIFVRRAAEEIAAAATSLEHLDALVFTGGIGENAAGLRAAICARLAVLGVPPVAEDSVDEDKVLAGGDGTVAVMRIEAREDLVIAEQAASAIGR
ncbi:MAG TPA: acetate/propionate family kinase [Candidatus Limnocylindrales bacterium]